MRRKTWARTAPPLLSVSNDDTTALFNPGTGQTHFLSDLPLLILEQVGDAPIGMSELIERLGGSAELGPDAQQLIKSTLSSLEREELVVSVGTDSD